MTGSKVCSGEVVVLAVGCYVDESDMDVSKAERNITVLEVGAGA